MTAHEIRQKASLLSERSSFARYEQSDWLAEIAAQLAELNESINRMTNDQGALDVVVLK